MKALHAGQISGVVVDQLFELERCGKYDEALRQLEEIWDGIKDFSLLRDFPPEIAAELILRCGTLTGYIGHQKQFDDSQEKSKNLVSDARRRFLELQNFEKVAEAEVHLALCYSRKGQKAEAEIWVNEALSHKISEQSFPRLHACIVKSLIFFDTGRYNEIIKLLELENTNFVEFGCNRLLGDYYNYFGLALRNLGENDLALEKYEKARVLHQKSGNKFYLGTIENNIAYLCKKKGLFTKAHQAIDNAIELFRYLEDKTREAFALDTKAQIFYAEERYFECTQAINKAIENLEPGENKAYLVEAMQTKIRALIAQDDIFAATECLIKAENIAKTNISEDEAEKIKRVFETAIRRSKTIFLTNIYGKNESFDLIDSVERLPQDLKLILPPSISHYNDFQAIWINNSYLDKYGLEKGCIALVASNSAEIKRGDLVAVVDHEDFAVCGIYDKDFGIICLEKPDDEPQLFDENEVEILGKIVGYGKPDKKNPDEIQIKSIKTDSK